jgi:hypothetical protein
MHKSNEQSKIGCVSNEREFAAFRRRHKLTQQQAAELFDISAHQVWRLETHSAEQNNLTQFHREVMTIYDERPEFVQRDLRKLGLAQ